MEEPTDHSVSRRPEGWTSSWRFPATGGSDGAILASGVVLAERYRIDAFIARGGMGVVYRATDQELGVTVALKTIRSEIASDPASLRRFKQEVLLARSISHPYVCRIYDIGRDTERDLTFLTMEFLEGESLAERLRAQGALAPTEALPIVRQLAEALDAAHRAGIVHRDLKSANVMLVASEAGERAVITDFGLAVTAEPVRRLDSTLSPRHEPWGAVDAGDDSSRSAGIVPTLESPTRPAGFVDETVSHIFGFVGTPEYMAPEQVRGEAVSPVSDLYSLGVVLYEMTTGRLPFQGSSRHETAHLRLVSEPPSLSLVSKELPADWDRVVLRLLAREPADRYSTGRDVILELEGQTAGPEGLRYSLPAERDAFVGRDPELRMLSTHLESRPDSSEARRLMTLLGPGGTGKTRLALNYGWTSLQRWPGGVWFCDLSEARSVEGIAAAVASSLQVSLGREDPVVQLGHAIAGRGRSLVILDNFEHLVELAEATVGHWTTRCTDTSFLITSRERLQLAGEDTVLLDPLDPGSDGVLMFEHRARTHRSGFSVTDENRDVVAEIVTGLEGLPLAIELAAARLRILGLDQLRDRLKDRFSVLTGGQRGRHRALETTLDWSWDLLNPWERSALAQLSTFERGCTLEAAEAVLDLSASPEAPPILDVLQALIDKSLVRTEASDLEPRFLMYVTIQQYATTKLDDTESPWLRSQSELRSDVEERHGAYFRGMGSDQAIEAMDGHGGQARRAKAFRELDNLVTACRRAVIREDPETAVLTFAAAWSVLFLTGPISSGIELGRQVSKMPNLEPVHRASICRFLGAALKVAGAMDESRTLVEEALATYRAVGDRKLAMLVLGERGILDAHQGRLAESESAYREALRLCDELLSERSDDALRGSQSAILGNLASLCLEQGRFEEAESAFEQSRVLSSSVGDLRREAIVEGNLGILSFQRGDLARSRAHLERALDLARQIENRRFEGHVLGNLGMLHYAENRIEDASRHYEQALRIHRDVGNRRGEGIVLGFLGTQYRTMRRHAEAEAHTDQAIDILREVGDLVQLGRALCTRGMLACDRGDVLTGRESLVEVRQIEEKLGVTPESELGRTAQRLAGMIEALAD